MTGLSERVNTLFISYREGLIDVTLAWFPWIIAFLFIPLALYLPNQGDFNYDLFLLIPFFYFLFLSLALSLLLLFFPEKIRSGMARLLFFFGLFLAISDLISARRMTVMTGFESATPGGGGSLPELGLLLILAVLCWRLPWSGMRRSLAVFVLLTFAIETVVLVFSLSPLSHSGKTHLPLRPPPVVNQRGNIYQIVLDSYNREILPPILQRHQLGGSFSGFYLYRENRSNYLFTAPSVASYLTGSFYRGGSMADWLATWKKGGLMANLADDGYEISAYAVSDFWLPEAASHFTTNDQILGEQGRYAMLFSFADLWLLRLAPDSLQALMPGIRQGVLRNFFGVSQAFAYSDIQARRTVSSAGLVRQCIADEAKRPAKGQYVYLHAYLPHPPFVFAKDCALVEKSSYAAQSVCATRLVAEFLDQLKALDRYRQATIIIQSDHSFQLPLPPEPENDTTRRIATTNLRGLSFPAVDQLSRALLMIKPPQRDKEPIAVSDHPTQLADIPATLYHLLDLPVRTAEGISVFNPSFPMERTRDIYVGFMQLDESGVSRVFGETFRKGEMNHYSQSPSNGWQIHDNIGVQW